MPPVLLGSVLEGFCWDAGGWVGTTPAPGEVFCPVCALVGVCAGACCWPWPAAGICGAAPVEVLGWPACSLLITSSMTLL